MKRFLNYFKKAAALLIVLIMVFEILPTAVFASDNEIGETVIEVQNGPVEVTEEGDGEEALPGEISEPQTVEPLSEAPAAVPKEDINAEPKAASRRIWSGTVGDYSITITNAPDFGATDVKKNTDYDQDLIKEAMHNKFEEIFALDFGFLDVAQFFIPIEDTMTVTVSGGNISSKTNNSKLWLIKGDSTEAVSFTSVDENTISFDISKDTWLDVRTYVFVNPSGDCSETDQTNIGEYHVAWSFKWANGIDASGSGKNYEYKNPETGEADETYLFFHPQDTATQGAALEVTIAFTGTQDQSVPAGSVEVRIPAFVFAGWNGAKADSIETMIPEAPATNNETFYNWRLDEETNEIVISNWATIAGNDYFHESFTYKVKPLDVNGGYPDEEKAKAKGFTAPKYAEGNTAGAGDVAGVKDIDRFCWNYKETSSSTGEYLWKDYYKNTGINCTITIDTDQDHENPDYYDYHNQLSLAMVTRAIGIMYTKPQPDGKSGVYLAWQSTWGPKPDDADDYVYVIWDVNYGRPGARAANQPWIGDVAYDASFPAITFESEDETVELFGEQIGEMKATWPITGIPSNKTQSHWSVLTVWGGDSSRGYYTNIARDTHNTTDRTHVFSFAVSKYGQIGLAGRIGTSPSSTGYVTQWSKISSPGDDGWHTIHYAVLVRYDKSDILENAEKFGIDLERKGLEIRARYTADETWESGYKPQRSSVGVAKLFVSVREGKGVFSKHKGSNPQTKGGQSVLLLDEPVTLSFRNFDGFRRYPYRMSYDGTSPSYTVNVTDDNGSTVAESRLYGQRIVITERWLMLSSAGATVPKGWHPEGYNSGTEDTPIGPGVDDGNTILTDEDYTIPFADIETFRDYEGTYSMGTWTEAGLYPYLKTNPIFVYIRYKNTSEYIPYFGFKYNSSGTLTGYLVKTENGQPVYDENGQPVLSTTKTTVSDQHNMLPKNVTGVRFEHETGNEVLRSVIIVNIGVTLNPTERVKDVIQDDVDAKVSTYVKNIADCEVYKGLPEGSDATGYESEPWLDLDSYGGGKTDANDVIWELTGSSPYLELRKNAYVPDGTDPEQIEAAKDGKEIAFIQLRTTNRSDLSTNITDSSHVQDRFKTLKGTFFDLLPKGTSPQSGSFIGVYTTTWSSHQYAASDYNKMFKPYKNAGRSVNIDGSWYFLSEQEYQVSTEYIPELDQYLLRIDYEFADPGYNYCPDSTWYCHMHFYFILENSFENIRARGNVTPNYTAFMSTKEGIIAKPGSSYRITAANLYNSEDVAQLFRDQTAVADGNAGCAKTNISWNAVTALEANFSKTVTTHETVNGVNQLEDYTSDGGRVTVGSRYTYRLRTTNMPTARTDDIIFYDIFETGVAGIGDDPHDDISYWQGKFESVDVSLIANTPTDQEGVSAKCAPVVYYSTVLSKMMDLADEELTQDILFDLDDTEVWSAVCPDDPSTVTAIAIDCRKTNKKDSNGEYIDFHLGPEASLTAYVNMVAPTTLPESDPLAPTVNGAILYTRPFNTVPGDIHGDPDTLMSKASLSLRDTEVTLVKNSDPDGHIEGEVTDDKRCQVEPDGTGTIVYRLTLRNTMPFDCHDIVVTDPIPEYLTFNAEEGITVKLNGAVNASSGTDTTGFRYELADDGRSFTFYIAQQHPTTFVKDDEGNNVLDDEGNPVVSTNKDTVIYIPVTVDELKDAEGKQVFARNYDNTATLVSANSKEIGDDTETMYHRAETYKVDIEKEWQDFGNYDRTRPSQIVLTLKSNYLTEGEEGNVIVNNNAVVDENGNPPTLTITPDEDGNWKGSFTFLPKYFIDTDDADYENPNAWHEIKYVIEEEPIYDPKDDSEDKVPIYEVSYDPQETDEGTLLVKVTNIHVPRVGDIRIRKYIERFELSEDATFVFDVVATLGTDADGKPLVVYTNVAVLTVSKDNPEGTLSTILENIPAGAEVTVTEVYTGSHYKLKSDPEQTTTIVADRTVSVNFTNDYNHDEKGGHGAANIFDPDDSELGWKWTKAYSTPLKEPPLDDAEVPQGR